MLNDRVDIQAIQELRVMARFYERRGNLEKAEELLKLVDEMERRLRKGGSLVDMESYRDHTERHEDQLEA